jgi:hypothetical protein
MACFSFATSTLYRPCAFCRFTDIYICRTRPSIAQGTVVLKGSNSLVPASFHSTMKSIFSISLVSLLVTAALATPVDFLEQPTNSSDSYSVDESKSGRKKGSIIFSSRVRVILSKDRILQTMENFMRVPGAGLSKPGTFTRDSQELRRLSLLA